MHFIRRRHAAVLLLALTQSLVFASVDHEKKDTEVSTETIVEYLQGPWLNGLNWILRSSKTSGATGVKAFVRAVESRETWALQMLDVLRNETNDKISEENVQDNKAHDQVDGIESDHRYDSVICGDGNDSSFAVCERRPTGMTQFSQILRGINFSEMGENKILPESSRSPFNTEEICTLIFFATVTAFMTACTIIDIVQKIGYGKSFNTMNTLAKFSLYTNALNLLSTKVDPDTMPALHGMKVLSMCSIVLSHRFLMVGVVSYDKISILDVLKWQSSWVSTTVWIAGHCVDTFFVISGFLMTYSFFKSVRSGSKFSFLTMYLQRYLRLTPCLAAVLLIIVVLPHRLGSGSVWDKTVISQSNACRENWWVNLLYLQNFVKIETMCMLPLWYLAVDMQLFLVTPFILYLLHRWPKFGLGTIGFLFTVSMISPALIIGRYYGHHNAFIRIDMDYLSQLGYFVISYASTLPRGVPYLIGMLLGYDVANKRRHFSQITVIVNWAVAIILLLLSVRLTDNSENSNFAYNQSTEAFVALVRRPSWSIGIAWIVYACTQGYGGLATRFLSLPIFVPLSRLSYCIYLVHTEIQLSVLAMTHTSVSVFGLQNLHGLSGDLLLSAAVAFPLYLLFESPSIVLKNILQNRDHQLKPTSAMQKPNKSVDAATDKAMLHRTVE